LFYLTEDLIGVGEVKTTHSNHSFKKAREQLERAKEYLKNFNFCFNTINGIYIPGNSKYLEV